MPVNELRRFLEGLPGDMEVMVHEMVDYDTWRIVNSKVTITSTAKCKTYPNAWIDEQAAKRQRWEDYSGAAYHDRLIIEPVDDDD